MTEEITPFWRIPYFRLAALAFVLVLLCSMVFLMGGYYACKGGNGYYSGYACHDLERIGYCDDITGKKYRVPDDYILDNNTYIGIGVV